MKRSKLRNFLFPSILFHLGLVAVIALAVIYFAEEREDKGEGTIIVGIVEGDEPAQSGEAADETATAKEAHVTSVKSATVKAERREPERPIVKKAEPVPNTEVQTPVQKSEITPRTGSETKTDTANQNEQAGDSATIAASTNSIKTASHDAGSGDAGKGSNPALGKNKFRSAYPDYDVNPKPVYPTAARRRGYEGDVKLRVLVLENGKVGKIEIEKPSGYEVLDESALKTVNDWVFVPGKEDGKEVSSWVTVPISFRLNSG